ncbi:membrane protein [Caballeronia novacaledonica]|uniref:Membrane protein n=1 Tax=Caballeronia novacaledonica TaxID=1544861 RepID=A0A2U3I5M6_9BURK|nr:VC0807 family protein [Caballeronia novacaledonica]SPB15427.1 membrane protein [Caballeronia novacaledonica]
MMIPSARYGLALVVNVALPALVYRLTNGRYGVVDALIASAVPLIVWMVIDVVRYRHFDALSANVLAGIAMSLMVLLSGASRWMGEAREPAVSGIIGVLFLLSLFLDRPMVFYLARSTMSREKQGRETEFDARWQSSPALVRSIRLMTVVWGIGLVGENVARLWIMLALSEPDADRLSTWVRYGVYGGLTVWTFIYRRIYIRRRQ